MDAKDQPKDAVPKEGEGSEVKSPQDSKPQKLYAEDEVEAKFSKQRSALDKVIAGKDKTIANLSDRLKDVENLLTQRDKEEEEKELQAADGDDKVMRSIRDKQQLRQLRADITKLTAERDALADKNKEVETEMAKTTQERNARDIATRLNVDVQPLLKFVAKATDISPEDIEDFAAALPKLGEKTPVLEPDSSKSIGGQETIKRSEAIQSLDPSKMTPQEITQKVIEIELALKEGRLRDE